MEMQFGLALESLATYTRTLARRYYTHARDLDPSMTQDDWIQHSRAAAFLAYVDIGGDPEAEEPFDPAHPLLRTLAVKKLRQATLGAESAFVDTQQRWAQRREGALNDELRWDCWQYAVETPLDNVDDGSSGTVSNFSSDLPCTEAILLGRIDFEHVQADFVWELAQVLKPQELVWLLKRYRDNIDQQVLADDLIAKDARYAGEGGRERAINYINVTIHRAKHRARAALAGRWQAFAADMA